MRKHRGKPRIIRDILRSLSESAPPKRKRERA